MTDWDTRFLDMAKLVASWSKDPSTKTGAVIVRPDKTILSVGFNGFPAGMNADPALYADRQTKYDRIIHCEINAVLSSPVSPKGLGCTLYTYPFISCKRCAVHMVQSGIVRAVAPKLPEHLKERWDADIAETRKVFEEANVSLLELDYEHN